MSSKFLNLIGKLEIFQNFVTNANRLCYIEFISDVSQASNLNCLKQEFCNHKIKKTDTAFHVCWGKQSSIQLMKNMFTSSNSNCLKQDKSIIMFTSWKFQLPQKQEISIMRKTDNAHHMCLGNILQFNSSTWFEQA